MTNMDVTMIEPQRQKVWGWPAVINFTFGSAGAALYLLGVGLQLSAGSATSAAPSSSVRVVAAGFVALGLSALASEAGRPLRAGFLLRNLRRSWMARETLAALIFVPASLLSWQIEHPLLLGIAAVAAAAFIISQGFIVYRARAIPAWNTPLIPVVFLTSAFLGGSGILLALPATIGLRTFDFTALVTVVICSTADVIVWLSYLQGTKDPVFRKMTAALRTRSMMFWSIAVFRLAPISVVLAALAAPTNQVLQRSLLSIAGMVLFAAALAQKTAIIRTCGFLRSIKFSLTPCPATRLQTRSA